MGKQNNNENAVPEDVFKVAAEPLPLRPRAGYDWVKASKHYEFYKKIVPQLRRWWDEFATELDDTGRLKHRTLWQFIRRKTKNETERELLWEMLGPEPEPENRSTLRVPWLGDWSERRKQGFNNFEDPKKFMSLKLAVEKELKSLESAKAIAPIIVRNIAKWERISEQITEAFGDQPISPKESPDSEKNKKRLLFYIGMQKKVLEVETKLWDAWMRCNGFDPSNPSQYLAIRGAESLAPQLGDGKTIEGELVTPPVGDHQTKAVALPDGVSIDDLLLAKMMRDKAKTYKMQLPGDLNPLVEDTSKEDVEKAKKKVH